MGQRATKGGERGRRHVISKLEAFTRKFNEFFKGENKNEETKALKHKSNLYICIFVVLGCFSISTLAPRCHTIDIHPFFGGDSISHFQSLSWSIMRDRKRENCHWASQPGAHPGRPRRRTGRAGSLTMQISFFYASKKTQTLAIKKSFSMATVVSKHLKMRSFSFIFYADGKERKILLLYLFFICSFIKRLKRRMRRPKAAQSWVMA